MTSLGIWPFQRKESCLKFVDLSETTLEYAFVKEKATSHQDMQHMDKIHLLKM